MNDDGSLFAAASEQRNLINALRDPRCYAHPVEGVVLLETHISYVLLTGHYAYKIKKAVKFSFLDYSGLEQRRVCCESELRLNRRLAPALYLAVVPILGPAKRPRVGSGDQPGGREEVIEFAVRMIEFPQSALFDRRLAQGELRGEDFDRLADQLADFHADAAVAERASGYGSPVSLRTLVSENFRQLRAAPGSRTDSVLLDDLKELEAWSRDEYARLAPFLGRRQRAGFIRECHGDLHLGNIALVDGRPTVFDGIEFAANLRWIDVISEVAFLGMDLEARGRRDYAYRFINRYLENSGDYGGLPALPYYEVYRALVRAMVAALCAAHDAPQGASLHAARRDRYLACARRAAQSRPRQLLLMHGVSGSGKSWLAQAMAERLGAVRVRSDVERKRLGARFPKSGRRFTLAPGSYDARTTWATYQRLARLARLILNAGFPAIVDAASLLRWQRDLFRQMAGRLAVPFRILSCQAAEPVLRQRLRERHEAGNDASDAGLSVLANQWLRHEPLGAAEALEAIIVDTGTNSLNELLQGVDAGWPR